MMLPLPLHGMPQAARCAWPPIVQRYWDLFGHAEQADSEERREVQAELINRVRVQASQKAVTRLDEALGWLWHVEVARHRRAIVARMLTHPVSDKPVHSWFQIGKKMGVHPRTVRRWYMAGIEEIVINLKAQKFSLP